MHRLPLSLICAAVLGVTTAGCQTLDPNTVPWWRGIPARLTAVNSLEAEMWRRQHGYPGNGPPLPSRPMVGPLEPITRPARPPESLDIPQLEPAEPEEPELPAKPADKSSQKPSTKRSSRTRSTEPADDDVKPVSYRRKASDPAVPSERSTKRSDRDS